jgi:hypothetical protein
MILAALVLTLSCVVFIESFLFLELGKQARGILASARDALRTMTDAQRSDEEKELCTRRAALAILTMTGAAVLKLAAIAAVLAALFWGFVLISPESEADLTAALVSPAVIASLTLAGVCYVWARNAILRQI